MPELIWIVGPNGVGKTQNAQSLNGGVEHFTLDAFIMNHLKDGKPSVLNDLINNPTNTFLREQFITHFGNYTQPGEADLHMACFKKINNNESFSFENNFLPPTTHRILNIALEKGYSLSIIALVARDFEELKFRVNQRSALTGQFVAEDQIELRFNGGLRDINNLLDPTSSILYKNHIENILIYTIPRAELGMDLILEMKKNKVVTINSKIAKEYEAVIPNLKLYQKSISKNKGIEM